MSQPAEVVRLSLWGLLFWLLVVPVAPAHDVEVHGYPENLPPAEHISCEQGLAGGYPCSNMELVEFVPLADFGGQRTNDIWGWTDPLTEVEYVIIGVRDGTAFFELDDYGHPSYLGALPTRSQLSSWRDMKVYENHAYIVSEANFHGMQVFDLTRLRLHEGPPISWTSDADYVGFTSAHNIAINEESGFAYVVGTQTCNGGLHMINIREPKNPRFVACYSGDGYTHDTQCVIYHGPDEEFQGREICFSANEDTVTIVDVTKKVAPVMLSRTPYFSSRYTHQGWLSEDHAYFFLDDELDERDFGLMTRTFVWDMSDLRAPSVTGAHWAGSTAIDHNQYTRGNHVFQANYRAGIRVLRMGDLSQAEMVEVAYFDTSPADDRPIFAGTWSVYPYFESGFIAASDINKGLFILRPDLAAVPECSDGIDNDGDGLRDHPEDPTCPSPDHASERVRLDVEIELGPDFSPEHFELDYDGEITVVMLGSDAVNVLEIDPASLRLGPEGAAPLALDTPALYRGQRHFDEDRYEDWVMVFEAQEVGAEPHDHEVCLEGTIRGDAFIACYALAGHEHEDHAGGADDLHPPSSDGDLGGGMRATPAEPLPSLTPWGIGSLILQLSLAASWVLPRSLEV